MGSGTEYPWVGVQGGPFGSPVWAPYEILSGDSLGNAVGNRLREALRGSSAGNPAGQLGGLTKGFSGARVQPKNSLDFR